MLELGGWKIVVLHRVARPENLGLLKAWNLMHGRNLHLFGKACREAINVHFYGIPALWFYKELMARFVGKTVNLVFYAGAIARATALYGPIKKGALVKA